MTNKLIQAFRDGEEMSFLEQEAFSRLRAGLVIVGNYDNSRSYTCTRNPFSQQIFDKLEWERKQESKRERTLPENIAYTIGRALPYLGHVPNFIE